MSPASGLSLVAKPIFCMLQELSGQDQRAHFPAVSNVSNDSPFMISCGVCLSNDNSFWVRVFPELAYKPSQDPRTNDE